MFDPNKKIVYQDTLDEYHKKVSALIGKGGSQISTIPTASEDYENVIYQYIGDTDSTYTNGYFYKCIEDPENTGEYIWINISTQAAQSGGGGGHTILDPEDTEMTQRANLKFGGDFEVSDNSTDDETEIAPHELTNEDMAEIMSTLPSPVNRGVVYDDTERVIGTWFGKPLYQKTFTGLSIALLDTSGVDTGIALSDVSTLISVQGIDTTTGSLKTKTVPLLGYVLASSNVLGIFGAYCGGTIINILTLQYTKTTDAV